MVIRWSWKNGLEVLEVNADKIFYASAGQTFVCLENNKLRSFFKCSSVFGTEGNARVWSLWVSCMYTTYLSNVVEKDDKLSRKSAK